MARHGWKLLELLEMAGNGCKCLELSGNDQKRLKTARLGCKQLDMKWLYIVRANISNRLFDQKSQIHGETGFPGGNKQTDGHPDL